MSLIGQGAAMICCGIARVGVRDVSDFFAELKRRQMFRVAAAYAVLAWLLLQVVNNVAPALRLPEWSATLVLVLLLVGFPITLLAAWARELGPDSGGTVRFGASKLDYVLVSALVLVIGLLTYQQFASSRGSLQQASVAQTAPLTQSGISIAVLPFANLSDEREQEFFSDGMTDEIMTALARVQSLSVVARESAFQYKGERNDMRAVGQALNAQYLINGSVRRAGNRVRITAQLVRSNDGVGLWTDNYDRELTDIFAIQEDIAQAIAGALRVPLGLQQGENLISNRSISPESYEQYLRAKALVRARGLMPLTDAAALLEQVVARDANYAPAWALLSLAYSVRLTFDPTINDYGSLAEMRRIVDATVPKAEAAARRAIQLDASLADGYSSLGLVERVHGNLLQAEELYLKALALDPGNPDALHLQGRLLSDVARLKDALAIRQQLRAVEPFVPIFNVIMAQVLWLNGQDDAALAILNNETALFGNTLAEIYAATGRYNDAADVLIRGEFNPAAKEAAQILRTAPARAASPEALPRLNYYGFIFRHVGAPERAIEFYERVTEAGYSPPFDFARVWHPSYASVRQTERFKAYLRRDGFVDYWRERGWPDLCRPVGADDFVCS
jgi:TolB-like protein